MQSERRSDRQQHGSVDADVRQRAGPIMDGRRQLFSGRFDVTASLRTGLVEGRPELASRCTVTREQARGGICKFRHARTLCRQVVTQVVSSKLPNEAPQLVVIEQLTEQVREREG
jgi:hypothetical protein